MVATFWNMPLPHVVCKGKAEFCCLVLVFILFWVMNNLGYIQNQASKLPTIVIIVKLWGKGCICIHKIKWACCEEAFCMKWYEHKTQPHITTWIFTAFRSALTFAAWTIKSWHFTILSNVSTIHGNVPGFYNKWKACISKLHLIIK